MTISVTCHVCGTKLTVADSHAGKKGRCPLCETILPIPAQPASPAPNASVTPPPIVSPPTTSPEKLAKYEKPQPSKLASATPPLPQAQQSSALPSTWATIPANLDPDAKPVVVPTDLKQPVKPATPSGSSAPVAAKPPRFLDAAPPVAAQPSDADEAVYVAEIVPPAPAQVPAAVAPSPASQPTASVSPASQPLAAAPMQLPAAPAAAAVSPPAKPAASPLRPLAATDIRREVMTGFKNAFVPVQSSQAYRMGLVFSTAFMLLIPVLYTAMLILPGFLIWAVLKFLVPGGGVAFWGVVLPLLVILTISSLFLILKPILFSETSGSHTRTLTPQAEPLLFEFVFHVCDLVKAPRPRQIEINCDINAFASFRLGWLSLLSKDFSLTLGVPLIAGLNLQQFAGVLAHEFGHFSQGSAMRLTFLMRSINWWMVQAVYGRDRADEMIDNLIDTGSILTLFGLAAKLLMQFPRLIMWLLLRIGHLVVGNMLQQMEFDADRYESHMSGSHTFQATCKQIRVIEIAWEGAQQDMSQYYRDGRLVDNLPRLIMENVTQIPPKVLKKAQEKMAEIKTQLFDSHPSDTDRIASVDSDPQPGVFQSALPAISLFANFEAVAKGVTYDYYKDLFGDKIDSKPLLPVDDLLARQAQEKITWEALDRYFLDTFSELRPLVLPSFFVDAPTDANFLHEQLKVARLHIVHELITYRSAWEEYANAHRAGLEAIRARVLFQAGIPIKRDVFQNEFRNLYDVAHVENFAREEQSRLDSVLRPLETAAGVRLYAGLTLLFEPQVAARVAHAAAFQHEVRTLLGVVELVAKNWPQFLGLIGHDVTVETLFTHGADRDNSHQFAVIAMEAFDGAHRNLIYFRNLFEKLEYPFDHVEGRMTISHYLLRVVPMPRDYGGVAEATSDVISGLQDMYNRSVARLCAIAEIVEKTLGLDPLVDPAPRPKTDE